MRLWSKRLLEPKLINNKSRLSTEQQQTEGLGRNGVPSQHRLILLDNSSEPAVSVLHLFLYDEHKQSHDTGAL